jgi:integrase/recombinase XerD
MLIQRQEDITLPPDKVQRDRIITLSELFNLYYAVHVEGAPPTTKRAKTVDIQEFLNFFTKFNQSLDYTIWTSSISKMYRSYLQDDKKLRPTTINRRLATLRHAASFIHERHYFPYGYPFEGVQDILLDVIEWKGISDIDIIRLKAACDARIVITKNKNSHVGLLEATVLHLLLCTGLRVTELCNLNRSQYYNNRINYIKRKGNKVSESLSLSKDAKEYLDKYLETIGFAIPDEPLLFNMHGKRMADENVRSYIDSIVKQANAYLPENEKIDITPHSCRHYFLKKIADKLGIHTAFELSGNVSIKEIYRYTRPSKEEKDKMIDELF